MKRRLFSIVLSVVMILSMLPMQVFAEEAQTGELQQEELQLEGGRTSEEELLPEEQETEEELLPEEQVSEEECDSEELPALSEDPLYSEGAEVLTFEVDEDLLPDSEELLAGYVDRAFFDVLDAEVFGTLAYDRLSSTEKSVYNTLKEGIKKIAAGEKSSSSISASFPGDSSFAAVFHALLIDMPYELYWFDKTVGLIYSSGKYSFYVSADYSSSGEQGTFQLNTTKTRAASAAAAKFQNVVNSAPVSGDYEILKHFHDSVIELVDYNYDAYYNDPPYGDPWQLIYVFDGDPSTKVVCEGYSKAFNYLCDAVGIDCGLVSGNVSYSSGGGDAHMWNIVCLDMGNGTESWFVDCTHDDAGDGYPIDYDMFLKAPSGGSVSSYYAFDRGYYTSYYYYDANMANAFGQTVLTLATEDYVDPESVVYGDFRDVLKNAKNGDTIDLKGQAVMVNDTNSDAAPLVINKSVTIKNGTLNLRAGGIVLGADLTLQNVELSFANSVRNAIVANGYVLTLDNVTRDRSARQVHLFCGSLTDYTGSVKIPASGDCGEIHIRGNTSLGNVYAGSLCSYGGVYNDWCYHCADDHISSKVIVEEGATGKMGTLYGCGALESPVSGNWFDFGEPEAPAPDYTMFFTWGNVAVKLYKNVFERVDGATMGSDTAANSATWVYFYGDGNLTPLALENVLSLSVEEGYLAPVEFKNCSIVEIASGAELDLFSVREEKEGTDFYLYSLSGGSSSRAPGLLTIGKEDCVFLCSEDSGVISGYVELQTANYRPMDKSTSGLVENGHVYVQCLGKKPSKGSNIVFEANDAQADAELTYNKSKGTWTAEATVVPMESFVISGAPAEISDLSAEYLSAYFELSYGPEHAGAPYEFGHTIKVEKAGGETYTAKWSEEDYAYVAPELNLALWFDTEYLYIVQYDWTKLVEPGVYTVSIETPSGKNKIFNTVEFEIEDDLALTVVGDSVSVNGIEWYVSDIRLIAPDGYTIVTDRTKAPGSSELTITEDRSGEFTYYLYPMGQNNYYTRTIKLNRDTTVPAVKGIDVWSFGGKATISVNADDGSGSGIACREFVLENPGAAVVTEEGGQFIVTGLVTGQEYAYTLIVSDNVGNVCEVDGSFVANELPSPQLALTATSSNKKAPNNFAYGDTVNLTVTVSAGVPVTVMSDNAKAKAKGTVQIIDAETGAVLYAKKGVTVSNGMKNVTVKTSLSGSKATTRVGMGEHAYYAVFIPDAASAAMVSETQSAWTEITVTAKVLTVSGLKNITVKDDGTGLIQISGKPKVSGVLKGDSVTLTVPTEYQLTQEDRVDSGSTGNWIGKFCVNVPAVLSGEDVGNYLFTPPTITVTVQKNSVPSKVVINNVTALTAGSQIAADGSHYTITVPQYTAADLENGVKPGSKFALAVSVYDQYGSVISGAQKNLTYSTTARGVEVAVQKDKSCWLVVTPSAGKQGDVDAIDLAVSYTSGKTVYNNLTVEGTIGLDTEEEYPVYCYAMHNENDSYWVESGREIYISSVEAGHLDFGIATVGCYGNDLYDEYGSSYYWVADGLDSIVGVTQSGSYDGNHIEFDQGAVATFGMTGYVGETGVACGVVVHVKSLPSAKVSLTSGKASYAYGANISLKATVAPNSASSQKVAGVLRVVDSQTGKVLTSKKVTLSNKALTLSCTIKCSAASNRVDAGSYENRYYAEFVPNDIAAAGMISGRGYLENLVITPKQLKVSGLKSISLKIGADFDGLVNLTGAPKLSGALKGDTVALGALPQLQLELPAGQTWLSYYKSRSVTITNLVLVGQDAGNYVLTAPKITVKLK